MVAKPAMSWVASRKEWQKMYRGTRYRVSCRQLNCPANKKASLPLANEWWQNKLAELHGLQPHRQEYERAIEIATRKAHWLQTHGQEGSSHFIEKANELETRLKAKSPPELDYWETPAEMGGPVGSEVGWAVWHDRLDTMGEPTTAQNKPTTIGDHVTNWLNSRKSDVKTGDISPQRWERYAGQLKHFEKWIGNLNSLTVINSGKLAEYKSHLLELVMERDADKEGKKGVSRYEAKARLDTVTKSGQHQSCL